MERDSERQPQTSDPFSPPIRLASTRVQPDLILPNPKLKLLDQVREVMRLKHYPGVVGPRGCVHDLIYTHVLRQSGAGMRGPLDAL